MPIIVIKFPIDWLHKSFKGSRPQINDEWDSPIFQCQVDVVGRFARVQHQSVPLQGFEWQRDFITAALNRVQGQVVAEELGSLEGCDIFFFSCGDRQKEMCCMSVFVLLGACWEVVRRKNNDHAQGKKTVKKYEQESQVDKNSMVENKRNQELESVRLRGKPRCACTVYRVNAQTTILQYCCCIYKS